METMSLCAGFLLAEYIWYCFIYRAKSNLNYLSFVLFYEETAQARCQFNLELCFSNNFTALIPSVKQ